ncbi:hypothetical protein J2S05_001709 [Alkalicoccobacillus murimartini]|uniref:Uncharacterized protein n=1 Tax=Alkalicoccobacillus murimartini TaxID=171685 RepID=A0ABT9YHD8_9BACI|nr:hypothetical protein [Alkalicoccobacillus murimartini]
MNREKGFARGLFWGILINIPLWALIIGTVDWVVS